MKTAAQGEGADRPTGRFPPTLQSWGSQKLSAEVSVVHQDLQLGAHMEVAPVDGDPGATRHGAHGRLQGVDLG